MKNRLVRIHRKKRAICALGDIFHFFFVSTCQWQWPTFCNRKCSIPYPVPPTLCRYLLGASVKINMIELFSKNSFRGFQTNYEGKTANLEAFECSYGMPKIIPYSVSSVCILQRALVLDMKWMWNVIIIIGSALQWTNMIVWMHDGFQVPA